MDMIECLMKFGFTKHESMLYVVLCKGGELSGYEASKVSGIPRSNAYLALAGLLDKGAVYKIDSDTTRYWAVEPEEFIANTKREFEGIFNYLAGNFPVRATASDPYITISGRNNIINKMKNIVIKSSERVYVSVSHSEIELIRKELEDAVTRGLKVVLITSSGCMLDGAKIYFSEKQQGQIRLIADSSHVLTGELREDNESTCLYSKNINLIQLIKDSLTNEIKLIEMLN